MKGKKKVLLLGSGYVGHALGVKLINDYEVIATTTQMEKLEVLEAEFDSALLLDTSNGEELKEALSGVEVVVVTIGAKNKDDYEKAYYRTAENLFEALLENKSVSQVIYTSSSGVYGDHAGNEVIETSPLLSLTPQGNYLIGTEKLYKYMESESRKVCVFRVSEIYGPNKEISKKIGYYKDKKAAGTGEQKTNMVHLDDIIGAICFAISESLSGVYNLCDDEHPARKDLYDKVSKQLKLHSVEFDPELTSVYLGNKQLSNEKIKKAGYKFIHPKRVLS